MKNSIGKDLISLFSILNSDTFWSKRIKNLEELRSIGSRITNTKNFWHYNSTKPLIFQDFDMGRKVYPECLNNKGKKKGVIAQDIKVLLHINIRGTNNNNCDVYDPLLLLSINFEISGEYSTKNTKGNVFQSWHLDKNIGNDNHKYSNFIHPEYHIHFGGDAMLKHNTLSFGNLLIIESPRLAHLPLDLPLAIDFVLKNFYEEDKHKNLTKGNRAYITIIKNSQNRLWKPYFLACARYWIKEVNGKWGDLDSHIFHPDFHLARLHPSIT